MHEAWRRARRRRLAITLVVVALCALGAGSYFWWGAGVLRGAQTTSIRVPSSAMEPTLHCAKPAPGCLASAADSVLVQPGSRLERGEIIAFSTPPRAAQECGKGGTFIKRVIGLPGDTVWYSGRTLRINGKIAREPYIAADRQGGTTGAWHVPNGNLFVMGDNRAQSCDSRRWGGVPRANVTGKVVAIERPGVGRINLP